MFLREHVEAGKRGRGTREVTEFDERRRPSDASKLHMPRGTTGPKSVFSLLPATKLTVPYAPTPSYSRVY